MDDGRSDLIKVQDTNLAIAKQADKPVVEADRINQCPWLTGDDSKVLAGRRLPATNHTVIFASENLLPIFGKGCRLDRAFELGMHPFKRDLFAAFYMKEAGMVVFDLARQAAQKWTNEVKNF